MSIKILTQNAIDNTNIDGARENHFSAGMRSGIVKGAFNEGKLFASSNNVIALDSCELRISGHRIILDSVEYLTLSNSPSSDTKKSLFAEVVVNETSTPSFRLFIENSNYNLKKDNLFKNNNGSGTYQIEIGRFMHKTNGTIVDLFRTIDVITGGSYSGDSDVEHLVFNGIATSLSSDSQPQVNIDYNEETKQYDFNVAIPKGERGDTVPNTLTIGSVVGGDTASATITGTAPNQVLNLVLPKGDKGDTGDKGESGDSSTPTVFELELEILKTTDTFATSFNNNGQIFTSTNFKYERSKSQKLNTDVYDSIFEQADSHKVCFVTINGSTYMGETYLPQNKVSFNIYIYREGYAVTFSRGYVYISQYSNSSTTSSITINSIEFR